jgi:hypothetical protein
MGSHSLKCHSGLLEQSQECFLIFVSKTNIKNTYIHGEYQMLSLPIECIYDDYGKFELKESSRKNYEIFEEWLKENMISLKTGENKKHDIEVNKEMINWNFTQKAIEKNRLFIKSTFEEENIFLNIKEKVIRNVEVFAVHKYYFEQVLKNYIYINAFDKTENFEEYNKNLFNFYENYFNFNKSKMEIRDNKMLISSFEKFQEEEIIEIQKQNYRNILDSNYTHCFNPLSSLITSSIYKLSKIDDFLLNEISKSLFFKDFIESNQFDLNPVRYSGDKNHKNLILHMNLQLNTIKLMYLKNLESFYYIMEENEEKIKLNFSETIESLYEDIENSNKTNEELINDEKFDKLIKLCI